MERLHLHFFALENVNYRAGESVQILADKVAKKTYKGSVMKKFLVSVIMFGAAVIAVPSIEAKTSGSASAAPAAQLWEQPGRRWGQRRTRTYTRIRRIGFRTYRETYRVTYRPNGRTVTRLISRVRIR
jgi:hypothetical protein